MFLRVPRCGGRHPPGPIAIPLDDQIKRTAQRKRTCLVFTDTANVCTSPSTRRLGIERCREKSGESNCNLYRMNNATDIDHALTKTALAVLKVRGCSGETPADVNERLREAIPNEVFPSVVSMNVGTQGRNNRVETTQVSLNNNPAHERPTPKDRSIMGDEIVRHSEETWRPRVNGGGNCSWDTLIRTVGVPTTPIVNSTKLFGNANIGNLALTNLQVAGQLASDQTYVILALRCWLFFDGANRRTNYLNVTSQLFWTLTVGNKPMFQAPC